MHRVARWGASHETPSALEPASYARAGEARLVERDLGEDAFVVTFHERKRELRRVVHTWTIHITNRIVFLVFVFGSAGVWRCEQYRIQNTE